MVWSSSAIPAAEAALFAADRPVLVGQTIPIVPTNFEWNAAGAYGADASATGYPARRLYDGLVDVWSKPSITQITWYVMMKFAVAVEIDTFALLGHNLGTLTSVVSSLEIADNDAFDSNLAELWTETLASDDRKAVWALDHTATGARRYAGVTRARLKLLHAAGAVVPTIHEIVLGRRCQMSTNPIQGFDNAHLKDISESVEANGGSGGEVIYSENQFVLDATWRLHQSADITNTKAWWKQAKRGYIFCEKPTTYPQVWQFMRRGDAELTRPGKGWVEREFTVSAVEQGPDQYYMENE